jgi:hypothetical protein
MKKSQILLFIFLIVIFIIILLLCFSKKIKDNYALDAVRGARYDPEIVSKSGGMAGFSTYPVDTHPDMGYINYPYFTYTYPDTYGRYYPYSSSSYGYFYTDFPYRNRLYNPYYSLDYLPQSLYSRTYYDRPYFERFENFEDDNTFNEYNQRLLEVEDLIEDENY